jgi:hypothetical protein
MERLAAYPHPALRATFSRKREKGFPRRPGKSSGGDDERNAPPLPLAGEGWGEGKPTFSLAA